MFPSIESPLEGRRPSLNPLGLLPLLAFLAVLVGPALLSGCRDEDSQEHTKGAQKSQRHRDDRRAAGSRRRSHRRRSHVHYDYVAPKAPFSGKVVRVSDGDTIHVELRPGVRAKIRISGVDAPEKAQPFGKKSHAFAQDFVGGKAVKVVPKAADRYGRVVATVSVDDHDLGAALLGAGLAWHYRHYDKSPRYAKLQEDAKASHRGLWSQGTPQAPWNYRREKRGKPPLPKTKTKTKARRHTTAPNKLTPKLGSNSTTRSDDSAPYHGNIRSHVFHARGCRNFDCKACRAHFATAAAARAAGYRPHERCVHASRAP
ncbi:MAG: thermonuclease family protein [Deltaproteobacteria bacterium]|nr:thermonuclease family protein [Deltaproteobacteria bacterium]